MDWINESWQDYPSNTNPEGYGVIMYRPSDQEDSLQVNLEVVQRVIPIHPDRETNGWVLNEIIQSSNDLHDYRSYPLFITTKQENITSTERMNFTKDFFGTKKMVIAAIQSSMIKN